MHPATHLLVGWTLAESARLGKRDRSLVVLATCLPDLDGLGVFADLVAERLHHPLYLYDTYHHVLLHNALTGLLAAVLATVLARRRPLTPLLVLLGFHLHLLGDILGSRGPDGYQWPIPYLEPFSGAWQLAWSRQWGLQAWPNVVLTLALMALALHGSWKRGRSPLELLSPRADAAMTRTLRLRFGDPGVDPGSPA